MFTGNKNIDYKIMMSLNDRDLLNFCQIDKYVAALCANDDFWRRRYQDRFGKLSEPLNTTWRNIYLYKLSGSYSYSGNGITIDVTVMKDSELFNKVYRATKLYIKAEKGRRFRTLINDQSFKTILGDIISEEIARLISIEGLNHIEDWMRNTRYMIYNSNIENELIEEQDKLITLS